MRNQITIIPKLPTWAQPIPPFVLSIVAAAAQATPMVFEGGCPTRSLLGQRGRDWIVSYRNMAHRKTPYPRTQEERREDKHSPSYRPATRTNYSVHAQ